MNSYHKKKRETFIPVEYFDRPPTMGHTSYRMDRAGKLLEAANDAERIARQLKHFALIEFSDARRELDATKKRKLK